MRKTDNGEHLTDERLREIANDLEYKVTNTEEFHMVTCDECTKRLIEFFSEAAVGGGPRRC
jgi:hypothetical protein